MFNPEIKVIDLSRNPLNIKLESCYYNPDSAPLAFDKTWLIHPEAGGDYYVILDSNNSKLQQTIYSDVVTGYTGMLAPWSTIPILFKIKSTLVGDFRIQLQEE